MHRTFIGDFEKPLAILSAEIAFERDHALDAIEHALFGFAFRAIGAWAALKREKVFDQTSSNLLLLLASLPEFVVALVLVILFATTVSHVLPAISTVPPGSRPWNNWVALVLPILTLVIAVAPYVSRIMRASMIEVLESDYVEMAGSRACRSAPC